MLKTSTLRPGVMVSLKTSVRGNVTYTKRDLEVKNVPAGTEKVRWETTRLITDPKEHEEATKLRSKVRSLITGVCTASAFALLCPETEVQALEAAMKEARRLAQEFNDNAKLTRVGVYIMTGRIAPDDAEAVRAISAEMRELMEDMEEGVKNLDAKAIRAAANQAREVSAMLSPQASAAAKMAIEAARGAARKIVKAGEQAAHEVDLRAVRQISEARMAFLDLGEATAVEAPVESGRALDLGPGDVTVKEVKASAAALEL